MSRATRSPCRVLFAAAEVAPYAQVGGLGDVAAALPAALAKQGAQVTIVTPLHRAATGRLGEILRRVEGLSFEFAGRERAFAVIETRHPRSGLPVLHVDLPGFFDASEEVYGLERGPEGLADLKWAAFAALIQPLIRGLGLRLDVLHLNDWHSALAAALLRTDHARDPLTHEIATVLTLHNAAFQGRMPVAEWRRAGIREDLLSEWILLQDGEVNPLKAGVLFADRLTTVSPTYAREIMGREGAGLAAVFESRGEDLQGILNGIDTSEWDPARDARIAAPFNADDTSGKDHCRDALLAEFGLRPSPGPVLAFIGRLTHQKGVDLLLDILPELRRKKGLRLLILGTGEPALEARTREAAQAAPDQVAAAIRFDAELAHRIEAGADILVMPSRFEPCGLNQLISHRYATIPVVRRVGGLQDSVRAMDRNTAGCDGADGFAFGAATPAALGKVIDQAISAWRKPEVRASLRRNAMARRHDWEASARLYLEVYADAMAARARRDREDELLSHLRIEPGKSALPEHRAIPGWFEKDILFLGVQGPRRLWSHWEVQGRAGKRILDAFTPEELWSSRWELCMTELDHGGRWKLDVEGLAKNWFIDVEAGRRYQAELWLECGGKGPILMGRSNLVETPPEIPA